MPPADGARGMHNAVHVSRCGARLHALFILSHIDACMHACLVTPFHARLSVQFRVRGLKLPVVIMRLLLVVAAASARVIYGQAADSDHAAADADSSLRGSSTTTRQDRALQPMTPTLITPTPLDFVLDYYQASTCSVVGQPEGQIITSVLGQQTYCQAVTGGLGGAGAGATATIGSFYKVVCAADQRSGTVSFCSAGDCADASCLSTGFTSHECLAVPGLNQAGTHTGIVHM